MRVFTVCIFLLAAIDLFAQKNDGDTTKVLDQVIVKGYKSNRPLADVPATINVINSRDLNRFGPTSLVTTVNTTPGVRMEERSPGSYRFSIRGSVLRSPFGIRNVKFYWKGLPFTDGGGNTYFNLLDMATIGSMEILKGPGASLYGASTGGVVLLDSPPTNQEKFTISMLGGSYGLSRFAAQIVTKPTKNSAFDVGISQQHSDGYRQQSALDRLNIRMNYDQAINNHGKLSFTYLYANLAYQTPGGLTLAQYEDDPQQARPATKVTPGAIEQKAKIYNSTHYLGAMYQHDWNEHWTTNIGAYGSITDFKNPTILNYEHRNENNIGARTETQYSFAEDKARISFGAEAQMLFGPDRVYWNNNGVRDTLRTDDRLKSKVFFTFAQAEFQLPYEFLFTAGGSLNFLTYDFNRVSDTPDVSNTRNFKPGFFPRIALIKKFGRHFSIYSSLSNGFSAPTLAEVLPSTSQLNKTLNAEKGRSVEVGVRGDFFDQLRFNVTTYDFRLKETIVVRPNASGADSFVNAGTTSQKGIESTISWTPSIMAFDNPDEYKSALRLWMSYTYNNYHFLNYVSGSTDLSGNRLTGVPPTVVVGGVDYTLAGWYLNASINYTDHIPVNDANSEFAHDYKILSARVGKRFNIWNFRNVDVFAGVDNAFNEKYSLGNDLNAAGARYYNLASGRGFYGGLNLPLYRR
ncbi:MAG: TonB-dependent receptor plug domain-containing protein [Bacteroidota bacterium]